jgi:ribosomal protein S18 acetylase RimI-like enzyme
VEAGSTLDSEGLPVRPQPDGSDIRKATDAELPRAVEAAARSFYDDPLFTWVFLDDGRRLDRLRRGFDLWARRIWFPQGETYTTDRVIGAAFWMPPDTSHLGLLQRLRMLPAMATILRSDLPRLLRLTNALESKHPHERHYYLPVIGILPEWQGRGFGAALLRPMLERCDREELPAYLEGTSPRNRALYERHGFKVVEEMTIKDSPPFWPMWREPQAA